VNKKNIIITLVALAILYVGLDKMGYLPGTIKQAAAVPTAVDLSSGNGITTPEHEASNHHGPSG
jgi:hypothetical protein